jgi:hypothetical protein
MQLSEIREPLGSRAGRHFRHFPLLFIQRASKEIFTRIVRKFLEREFHSLFIHQQLFAGLTRRRAIFIHFPNCFAKQRENVLWSCPSRRSIIS